MSLLLREKREREDKRGKREEKERREPPFITPPRGQRIDANTQPTTQRRQHKLTHTNTSKHKQKQTRHPFPAQIQVPNVSVCRFKTLPCVPAKRAHVEHMRAFCLYTRKRFEPTHGDVWNLHTGGGVFRVPSRATHTDTTDTTDTTTHHNTHHNTQHTTHNTQHTTHNTQHTTHNTQHTTHNTQHNTQHTKIRVQTKNKTKHKSKMI